MTLIHIAVFCAGALVYGLVLPARWRLWALMIGSVIAIYWLQPTLPIRRLDFVLPTATVVLAIAGWMFTRAPDQTVTREDRIALGITAALILALSATRYLAPQFRLTSQPPETPVVALGLLLVGAAIWAVWRGVRNRDALVTSSIVFIVVIFAAIKSEPLALEVSRLLRTGTGQDLAAAGIIDLNWLGFSYVAFRLIHTLRDRQTGRLPALSLREYLTYTIFFPAYTAGPIDRAEHFSTYARALPELNGMEASRWVEGGTRIAVGMFKKFVIADSLAVFALSATTAEQATSALSLWVLLYTYAFRLFFDFSGYTDIAIGIGVLFGFKLPENFDRPYLKNNIAAFWQSWHMTLSSWVRFYVFSPLSRWLLRRPTKPSTAIIMFICHLTTMVIIGLWHGVTVVFVVWGVWHGLGLFVHKLWSDRTRKWYTRLKDRPNVKAAWTITGVVLTFHFVVLGWVWFALPTMPLALQTFGRLFGVFW